MNGQKESLEQAYQSWAQGNFKAAYELYEHLLHTTLNDAEVLCEYGKAKYFEHSDLKQATQLFECAVNEASNSILALLWLGDLYAMGYGKGYGAALGLYQRVIKLDPRVVDAYIGIGMLYRSPSSSLSLRDAIEAFRTATQVDPQRIDAHIDLGMALIQYGDTQNAHDELEIAEKLLDLNGSHRHAQGIQSVRKKLEANQPVTSIALCNLSPRYKG